MTDCQYIIATGNCNIPILRYNYNKQNTPAGITKRGITSDRQNNILYIRPKALYYPHKRHTVCAYEKAGRLCSCVRRERT